MGQLPVPVVVVAHQARQLSVADDAHERLEVALLLAPTPSAAWINQAQTTVEHLLERETVIEDTSVLITEARITIRVPKTHLEAVLDWVIEPAIAAANELVLVRAQAAGARDTDDELGEVREILDAWVAEQHDELSR